MKYITGRDESKGRVLAHYGVKGMKWGKHLPGVDIPGQLSGIASNIGSGVQGAVQNVQNTAGQTVDGAQQALGLKPKTQFQQLQEGARTAWDVVSGAKGQRILEGKSDRGTMANYINNGIHSAQQAADAGSAVIRSFQNPDSPLSTPAKVVAAALVGRSAVEGLIGKVADDVSKTPVGQEVGKAANEVGKTVSDTVNNAAKAASTFVNQKKHQFEVDRKVAENKAIKERQDQHKADVDAKLAEGKAAVKAKQDQHKKDVDTRIKQAQHKQDVDRIIKQTQHKADVDNKIKQAQHRQEVDKKLTEAKQAQHRADVDKRISDTQAKQAQHKKDVDARIAAARKKTGVVVSKRK